MRTFMSVIFAFFSTSAYAGDLLLMTDITPSSNDGQLVQLREKAPRWCVYGGKFLKFQSRLDIGG